MQIFDLTSGTPGQQTWLSWIVEAFESSAIDVLAMTSKISVAKTSLAKEVNKQRKRQLTEECAEIARFRLHHLL